MRVGNYSFQLPNGLLSLEAIVGPLSIFLFVVAFGSISFLPRSFLQIDVPSVWIIGCGVFLAVMAGIRRFRVFSPETMWWWPSLLLLIYALSDLPLREHGFAQETLSPLLFGASLGFAGILTVIFARNWMPILYGILFAATAGAAVFGLLSSTSGSMIFSDDHPPFLYRLLQLRENFPFIPFYNPLWNGGVEAREFFPSGVLNFFLLMSPILYFVDISTWYTTLVALLLFGVAPMSAFASARIGGYSTAVGTIYATLSLVSSLFWYRWALAYGTVGFIVAAILLPLNAILISHFIREECKSTFAQVAFFVSTLTLMFLWSPSLLLFAPVILYASLSMRIALRKPWVKAGLTVAVLVNAVWLSVFVNASNVGNFLSPNTVQEELEQRENTTPSPEAHAPSKFKGAERGHSTLTVLERTKLILRSQFIAFNPLVLFFAVPGLFLLRHRSHVGVLCCLATWAIVLGLGGPIVKPQLELERMFVVLAFLLGMPAAIAIEHVSKAPIEGRGIAFIVKAVPIAALILMPFWLWRVTSNSTSETFHVASPLVHELTQSIRELPHNGRVMFAGFTLHELSGGHVAPLAAWTEKPLIASSYQHDKWEYTDVVPLEFRQRKTPGVVEYLNFMNVSAVVTHDSFWATWYSSRPKHFSKIWESGRFKIFRRMHPPDSYIHEGGGHVVAQNGNTILLSATTSDLVIKFNYFPFLSTDNCTIYPRILAPSVTFIALRGCDTSRPITIRAKRPLERFFLGH